MIFHIVTIFPEFFSGPFAYGVVKRAKDAGLLDIRIHNLRDWTHDRHKTVDDRPFGGGEGMVLKPEPLFDAVESIWPARSPKQKAVLLSAGGRVFDQRMAQRFREADELLLICGRYEGVDERVAEHLVDEEVSVGNFVLSGGELGAAIIVDAVARLLPGVLGNESSSVNESFQQEGTLDCPHWTRPAEFRGWKAPQVLLDGNHEEIRRFRAKAAREKMERLRADLLGHERPLTIAEYEQIPHPPEGRYELHHGRLALASCERELSSHIETLLSPHYEPAGFMCCLGYSFCPLPENELWTADVACIREERHRGIDKWLAGSPELSIYIRRPADESDALHDRAMTALAGDCAAQFWIVHPTSATITVYRKSGMAMYSGKDRIPLPQVRARLKVADCFSQSRTQPPTPDAL